MRLWKKIPVLIKAVVTGLLVAAFGSTPWALLISLNLKYEKTLPWSVPITAVYLWLFWRYIQGNWWPRSTSDTRKKNCRANHVPETAWGPVLLAGISGLVFIVLLQSVLSRMVRQPSPPGQDLSHIPALTLLLFLIMSALVAGVAEEAAFRGYMQGPIEKKYGPFIAIVVVGIVFGLAHLSHPEVSFMFLPYYLAVSAVYGMQAYLTQSIYPSLLLHAGGNMLSSMGLLMAGNVEHQATSLPGPLIWTTGADINFWMTCGGALLIGVFTVWAYSLLARAVREAGQV